MFSTPKKRTKRNSYRNINPSVFLVINILGGTEIDGGPWTHLSLNEGKTYIDLFKKKKKRKGDLYNWRKYFQPRKKLLLTDESLLSLFRFVRKQLAVYLSLRDSLGNSIKFLNLFYNCLFNFFRFKHSFSNSYEEEALSLSTSFSIPRCISYNTSKMIPHWTISPNQPFIVTTTISIDQLAP